MMNETPPNHQSEDHLAQDQCVRCGAPIPKSSKDRLCPACLLSGALVVDGETESMEASASPTPTRQAAPPPTASRNFPDPENLPFEFGGYRLVGFLGQGGMGSVYEAEQLVTGRRVALKLLGQHLDSPEMRQRFLREGRLAAGVRHPNSLYVFGAEEIDGHPVITMEIAGGGSLKDRLKKRGPFPVAEAVDITLDIIAGLEAAYAGGVLHRDVKPSNCFVSPDGSIKVGDFGLSVSTLAKSDTFVTATGVIMGTPAYAPPEQLRGDDLDVRADIYSVGATLYTLLTGRAPIEGENAVQVVANAIHKKPVPLTELRKDVPRSLERVVARCLAKDPDHRCPDYASLRNALLPFSSKVPEPASMKLRVSAGWIDYMIAFLLPYISLMLSIGGERLLIQPFAQRTLDSAKFYLLLLTFGFLYFSLAEGIWGGGVGKQLKGLRVVRLNGSPPGILRAFLRILVPIAGIEVVRIPLMLMTISDANLTGPQTAMFVGAAVLCPWIAVFFTTTARRENGYATLWDIASATRVIIQPKGSTPPAATPIIQSEISAADAKSLGPFQILQEIVPQEWILAFDPVLRRSVWLLRSTRSEPSLARRNLSRPGRVRWLQKVESGDATWDAYEAVPGTPFSQRIGPEHRVPWSTLRHWLHDLASELWAASRDHTLPAELSPDHVWITTAGNAILLERPWPTGNPETNSIPIHDLAGQQQFLHIISDCVDPTTIPLHARPVLQNLATAKFEQLSFLTGTLRGLLQNPTDVNRGIRAGAIFMLPAYIWILLFIGYYQGDKIPEWYDTLGWTGLLTALMVLGVTALIQLLEIPFHWSFGNSIFRLTVVNAQGTPAGISKLAARWAIAWLPLILPMSLALVWAQWEHHSVAFLFALSWLLLWIGAAAYAVVHPRRGLHDRLAGTWIVRR